MRKFVLSVVSLYLTMMSPTVQASIEVYAHRGSRAFSPENTLPAYRTTLQIGADWVDMDVVMTRDGEILVSHDLILNPDIVRDSSGRFLAKNSAWIVKNLTLEELHQYDVGRLNPDSAYAQYFPDQYPVDGTRMPTLREVIHYVKTASQSVGFQIEMKTDPSHPEYSPDPKLFSQTLYQTLEEEGVLHRTEIQAFDFRCLAELQALNPRVKTAYLTYRENERSGSSSFFGEEPAIAGLWTGGKLVKDFDNSIPHMIKALGGYAWEPEDAQLTQETLAEAHQLGLKVVVWSWPEKLGTAFDAKMTAKMIDWKVDGIITDDPGRLRSMLAARLPD